MYANDRLEKAPSSGAKNASIPRVFLSPRALQIGKLIERDLVERRSQAFAVLEQTRPPPITQQNVIQQSRDAAERPRAFLSVLYVSPPRAFPKEPLAMRLYRGSIWK